MEVINSSCRELKFNPDLLRSRVSYSLRSAESGARRALVVRFSRASPSITQNGSSLLVYEVSLPLRSLVVALLVISQGRKRPPGRPWQETSVCPSVPGQDQASFWLQGAPGMDSTLPSILCPCGLPCQNLTPASSLIVYLGQDACPGAQERILVLNCRMNSCYGLGHVPSGSWMPRTTIYKFIIGYLQQSALLPLKPGFGVL